MKTTTPNAINTAIAVDSNKSIVATRQEKKANKPSQQKPTNKAAVRLKPTNFTIHKRQTILKHKELSSRPDNYRSHTRVILVEIKK